MMAPATWDGDEPVCPWRYLAAAPATCGAAAEVPPKDRLALDDEVPAAGVSLPGANRSTSGP
jgi:hypothetical protein